MELQRLNHLDADTARAQFRSCCAASAWAEHMVDHMPFPDEATVLRLAGEEWRALSESEWREALSAHTGFDHGRLETAAEPAVQVSLERCLRQYRERFGYELVAADPDATGEVIAGLCAERLKNTPDEELRLAAAEQERITDLRLRLLLGIG